MKNILLYDQKWNEKERIILFLQVVLEKAKEDLKSKNIKSRLTAQECLFTDSPVLKLYCELLNLN